ncbi:MAG: hypothetical protein JWN15_1888 [Firmicutes bacterium]|nr:hypothetical protein [Bacillota bacterium]
MKSRRRIGSISLLLITAILTLTACGSSPTKGAAPGGTGSGGPAPSGEFELAVASGADPVDLDPRKTWVGPGYSMNAHLFEPLVFRKQTGDKMEIYPLLAESWKTVDPTTWEFKIRSGVKFHDGETLDAAAVAYTLTSIMDKDFTTQLKTWTNDIAKVEAKDAATLVITTKYPTRALLNSLAQVPIVAPQAAREMGAEFTKKPVGTGPYKIVSYTPNSSVIVERFDGYWGEKGKAKKITFRIMPENATRMAALEAGEVQIAENLSPDKLEKLKSNGALDVIYTPTLRVDWLVLQFTNKQVANLKFRQALSLAIDRDSLVKNILSGTTVVANSVSPPGTIGYDKSLPPFAYNLEKAKQLLQESGYGGEPIKMGAPIGRYSMDKQVNEAVAGMFKKLGVNVQFEALAWSAFIAKANEGQYDVYFIGQTDFTLNPTSHWRSMFYSQTARGKYNNPRVDQIIDQSAAELDDAKVIKLYQEGQKILYDDLAALPLYYEPQLIGVSKKLKGFVPRLDEYVIVNYAELTK